MLVLVYRKCSTCQKALKWLEEHKIFFEERAIVEENPTYEELKEWYERSGMPLKKFFNTSGMLYKQMDLKEKLRSDRGRTAETARNQWHVSKTPSCSRRRFCPDRIS